MTHRTPAKPPLSSSSPVDLDLEGVNGHDGRPIRVGDFVRCRSRLSPSLGVDVPARSGKVLDAYAREGGPVLLHVWGASGMHSLRADECKACNPPAEEKQHRKG